MIEREELHALADGELPANRAAELRAILAQSPEDQAVLEEIQALKQLLASAPPVVCVDEWKACVVRLNAIDKSQRVNVTVGRYSWALCGLFFLFILVGGVANRSLAGNQVKSEDIIHAASTLLPTRTPQARDGQAMNAYLDAMLGAARFSLAPDRMDVRAGAVGELNGRRVARLTLRDAVGDLSLLVVSGDLDIVGMEKEVYEGREIHVGRMEGASIVVWTVDNSTVALIGERPVNDLRPLINRISIR